MNEPLGTAPTGDAPRPGAGTRVGEGGSGGASRRAAPSGVARRRRHRNPRGPLALLAGVAVSLGVSGCSNPFSPEGGEVGVYKGASDPLFEQPAADRDAALRERLELIQKRGAAVPES